MSKAAMLQARQAVACIIAASKGQDVTLITCKEEECDWPLSIPATMIGHEAGRDILVGHPVNGQIWLGVLHYGKLVTWLYDSCLVAVPNVT